MPSWSLAWGRTAPSAPTLPPGAGPRAAGAGVWPPEQIDNEELNVFREILDFRVHHLTEEAKKHEARLAHPEKQPGLDMPDLPRGKATQLELRVAEWREKLEEVRADLTEVEEAQTALRKARRV